MMLRTHPYLGSTHQLLAVSTIPAVCLSSIKEGFASVRVYICLPDHPGLLAMQICFGLICKSHFPAEYHMLGSVSPLWRSMLCDADMAL